MSNTQNTEKLFARKIPDSVTWNEFFDVCDRARKMSKLLDSENERRKKQGRPTLLRAAKAHNRVVMDIFATIESEPFRELMRACEMTANDLPWVRYATHPKFFVGDQHGLADGVTV